MEQNNIYSIIILMALVTGACRTLPVVVFNKEIRNRTLREFLHYVPIAILYAMVVPGLLLKDSKFDLSLSNQFFWTSLPTLAVAVYTRSITFTVVAGVSVLALWRLL